MQCPRCSKTIPDESIYCLYCGRKIVAEPKKHMRRANGTGSVYKLQGRRKRPWVAAKNKVIIGYYDSRTAATEAVNRHTGQDLSERYNMTFEQVYEEWSAEHFRDISQSSIEGYKRSFDVFADLHGKKFRTLRTVDFQNVINQHWGKSYSTLSKFKFLCTQLSEWAIREELITTNFASFIKLPENVTQEKQVFSDADIEKLKKDNSEAAKIVLMLIYTGARINELFSLPLEDYHGNYVVGGEKTKAGKGRVIPIRPEGRAYFQYFAEQATGPLLLSGYVGEHVVANYRRRDYYPLLERLGIQRKTPHTTRHTYATWARKSGMEPEILQKILGHADYSTTANIYVHTDAEQLVKAVEC